jgi:hypothetical protein
LTSSWVQVEEVKLVGQHRGEGPVQRPFAIVTCSKACAVKVLAAAVEAEELAEQQQEETRKHMYDKP